MACFPGLRMLSWILSLLAVLVATHAQKSPHIIFILADDLGWADVSFHGSPDIPTPNIDALASSGVVLQRYYGDRLCTPSRAALLSGLYPFRLGLQHYVIRHGEPSALPLNVTTLPQHLKGLGYSTHMVGKWHLGCMTTDHTPVRRGFDSFFGYYYGEIDYYDHTGLHVTGNPRAPIFFGVDLHNGTHVVKNSRGRYATELFTEKAVQVINEHDPQQPLFLYLSHLAVHIGTDTMPLQAPPSLVQRFPYIRDEQRKVFAGMLSALDDSVGSVVAALDQRGMLGDSLVVFASDNGGETAPERFGFSSNAPLRGQKFSLWEGGVRVPALIFRPGMLREPRVAQQVMHVTDWLPTLYSMAGGNVTSLGDVDGVDQWPALLRDAPSPRSDTVLGLDPVTGQRALLRGGRWKAVSGNQSFYHPKQTALDQWHDPSTLDPLQLRPPSMDEWVWGKQRGGGGVKEVLERRGWFLPLRADEWRDRLRVECPALDPCRRAQVCEPAKRPCLFDLETDPCERDNLADKHPQVLQSMLEALERHAATAAATQTAERDPRADPRCHDFSFVPWLDPRHLDPNCPFEDAS